MTVDLTVLLTMIVPVVVSLFMGVLTWSLKRVIKAHDEKIDGLTKMMIAVQGEIKISLSDMQKEMQQFRIDSAMFKHTSGELTRHIDRIGALEKQMVLMDSKISAAFAILSGKRKPREETDESAR